MTTDLNIKGIRDVFLKMETGDVCFINSFWQSTIGHRLFYRKIILVYNVVCIMSQGKKQSRWKWNQLFQCFYNPKQSLIKISKEAF